MNPSGDQPGFRTIKREIGLFLAVMVLSLAGQAYADQPRKLKSQIQPIIPEMARRLSLKGIVRLEIEIGADGTVKSTRALGGHPLLIQSAEQAIRKWRYEPGPPLKTIVEFNFHQN